MAHWRNIGVLGAALIITSLSCGRDGDQPSETKVIYGADDRLEVFEATGTAAQVAASTAALVKTNALMRSASAWQGSASSLGSSYNLCSGERFVEQPTLAFCSGFLIADDTIVTAGHCIQSASDCASTSFVFGYAKFSPSAPATTSFPHESVYSCSSIVHTQATNGGADFAIVKLDRPVTGRAPLARRESGQIGIGEPLVVLGHPSGLPLKIAGGANVRTHNGSYFVANLDTYGGNSGSVVINGTTGLVEGILVRGETDYVSSGSCTVSNRCADGACRGEDVTSIQAVNDVLSGSVPGNGGGGGGGGGGGDEVRYVWLSDNTCNEFRGSDFIREVPDEFCPDRPGGSGGGGGEVRYVWLSDNTCNEFRGSDFVREVPDEFCPDRPGGSGGGGGGGGSIRYVWLTSDNTCNEFDGDDYIREVPDEYCPDRPASGGGGDSDVRYVWLDSDMTCNEFHGGNYIREVPNSYCGRD